MGSDLVYSVSRMERHVDKVLLLTVAARQFQVESTVRSESVEEAGIWWREADLTRRDSSHNIPTLDASAFWFIQVPKTPGVVNVRCR
jgi:hypothetical protein